MVLVVVPDSSVKDVPILFTKFAICTLYLMGNYAIEPVKPLDYNLSFYQPMMETGN